MGKEHSDDYRNIRFTRLTFVLQFAEDTELVRDKTSAIRGGIGEMLLREYCIADRNCGACGFRTECLVQRMMYSHFPALPSSVHAGDSVGYILQCADRRRSFSEGDTLEFGLTLFGNTIAYFSLYLNAVYRLGQCGLGRQQSHYLVCEVKNLFGKSILCDNQVYMERYRWQTLGDYVKFRREKILRNITALPADRKTDPAETTCAHRGIVKAESAGYAMEAGSRGYCSLSGSLRFDTPLCLKYKGAFVQTFSTDAIRAGLLRRLWILAHFENMPCENMEEYAPEEAFPPLSDLNCEVRETSRYSARKDSHMVLRGICGEAAFTNLPGEWLDLLLAGEITHIGKNTSFGFGKYILLPKFLS